MTGLFRPKDQKDLKYLISNHQSSEIVIPGTEGIINCIAQVYVASILYEEGGWELTYHTDDYIFHLPDEAFMESFEKEICKHNSVITRESMVKRHGHLMEDANFLVEDIEIAPNGVLWWSAFYMFNYAHEDLRRFLR